jgi:hypothetical protein
VIAAAAAQRNLFTEGCSLIQNANDSAFSVDDDEQASDAK